MTRKEAAEQAWEIAKANGYSRALVSEIYEIGSTPLYNDGAKVAIHLGTHNEDSKCVVGDSFEGCLDELRATITNRKDSRIKELRAELARLEGGK